MKLEGCKGERANSIVKPNPMEASIRERGIYYVLGIMLSRHFIHHLFNTCNNFRTKRS